MSRGRDSAARLGIRLLMDDAVLIGDTRFVGSILWTDFRFGSFSLSHARRTAQERFGMADYRRIRTGPSSRHQIEPGEVLGLHQRTRAFLEATLSEPHPGPTVVVTHHAPLPNSLPDPHTDLPWCYASDLRDLIHAGGPDLWVHGHICATADQTVGPTRIVCNPRGHAEETSGFDGSLII